MVGDLEKEKGEKIRKGNREANIEDNFLLWKVKMYLTHYGNLIKPLC